MAAEGASGNRDVQQVAQRFAEFRRSHAARSRLPEELWRTAAKLARRDGVQVTARALAVDQPSLKKWTERFAPQGKQRRTGQRPTAPVFVELLTTGPAQSTGCRVEVESPRGAKLRLEFSTIAAGQLAELIRAFAAS